MAKSSVVNISRIMGRTTLRREQTNGRPGCSNSAPEDANDL